MPLECLLPGNLYRANRLQSFHIRYSCVQRAQLALLCVLYFHTCSTLNTQVTGILSQLASRCLHNTVSKYSLRECTIRYLQSVHLLQDIIVNFLVTVGIGCGGILSAYMASLWAVVDNTYEQAAILTRVTAAVAVSYL